MHKHSEVKITTKEFKVEKKKKNDKCGTDNQKKQSKQKV